MLDVLKNKKVWIGIIMPIFIQLSILFVLIPAFKDMDSNVKELTVSVMNEDDNIGNQIAEELEDILPFQVVNTNDIEEAITDMEDGEYEMVIHIPSNFSTNIEEGTPELNYYINQAVAPTIKSSMEQAANEITKNVNENLFENKKQIMQETASSQLQGNENEIQNLPGDQTEEMNQMMGIIFDNLNVNTLKGNINKINNVEGMLNSIFPLTLFISTFISTIIMAVIHFQAFKEIRGINNRWGLFAYHQIVNIIAAILFPIASLTIISIFGVEIVSSTLTYWLFLSLAFWSFTLLTQMFVYIFGLAGEIFNALFMLFQVVSCGIIIPIATLPGFYKWISNYLPATYYSEGVYNLLFSGSSIKTPSLMLLVFIVVFLIIITIVVAYRKNIFSKRM